MNKTCYIYCLIDPIDGLIKYIGRSINPTKRSYTHNCVKRNGQLTKKESWIRGLDNKKLKPILDIIDEVHYDERKFWESHYIWLYLSWGFPLKNGDYGDDSKIKWTTEARKKISNGRKEKNGYKLSEETKKKMSNAAKLRGADYYIKLSSKKAEVVSEETKKKMSYSAKNRKDDRRKTDETKNKMTESAKNSWKTRIKKLGKDNFKSKPISQFNLDGTFMRDWYCAAEAARELNFKSPQYIGVCCNGHSKTAYNYIWKYKIIIK
jgi:hypothetical protein